MEEVYVGGGLLKCEKLLLPASRLSWWGELLSSEGVSLWFFLMLFVWSLQVITSSSSVKTLWGIVVKAISLRDNLKENNSADDNHTCYLK